MPGTGLKYSRNYFIKWFVQKTYAAMRVIFHLTLFLLRATSTAGIERDSNQFNLSGIPRSHSLHLMRVFCGRADCFEPFSYTVHLD